MRTLVLFLTAILLLTLQTTMVGIWGLTWGAPDLSLIFLVVIALRFGPVMGLWSGLLLGIAHDVYAVENLGAGALAMVLVGYAVGMAEEQVLRLDFVTKVLLLALAFLMRDLIHGWACGLEWSMIGDLFMTQSIPQGLNTLVVGTLWFYFGSRKSHSA